MNLEKLKLIYFGDPMCSTCYSFAPELKKVVSTLENVIDIRIVMGGLRPYNTQSIKELRAYLEKTWQLASQLNSQVFNFSILSNDCIIYDTEPACRAIVTMRKIEPRFVFLFFRSLQTAFYAKNTNITNTNILLDLTGRFGIDQTQFKKEFESENLIKKTKLDFDFTKKMGVSTFPTVALKREDCIEVLSEGFIKSDVLIQRISQNLRRTQY